MSIVHLTVVGSADAFNSMGRGHSCYILEGQSLGPLMIDFGATALACLRRLGREPTELKGIVLTHLHGDHIGGLPFLIIDGMFHAVRHEPLEILGPIGTAQRIDALMRACYGDLTDRERPFELVIRELAPRQTATLGGVHIEGFAADHMDPPDQPLCLRATTPDGKKVAFSGDTAMCDGLMAAADGVDLLVAECSLLRPPCGRHCTWEQWQQVLPGLSAKRVLFTHLNTEVRQRIPELLAETPDDIELSFAEDGLRCEL